MKKNVEEKKIIDYDLNKEDDFEEDLEMEEQAVEKVSKLRTFARNHKKGVIATIVITVVTIAVAVIAPGLTSEDDQASTDDETSTDTTSDSVEA